MVPCRTLDLGGTWQLHNAAGNVSTTATVPGEVHTDLLRAGVLLQDPYFRYNDIEYRWVVFQDWTVTRTFAADSIPEGAQVRWRRPGPRSRSRREGSRAQPPAPFRLGGGWPS